MDNANNVVMPMDGDYPNIQKMLSVLSESERTIGLLCLSMLPGETIARVEASFPELSDAHDADNPDAIAMILQSLGMSMDETETILGVRQEAMNDV